jgi:methylated-DNA-protein-cysteine methyltransferase-like protein
VIRRIPRGRVATYGDIARLAGLPGRARLVGHILRSSVLSDSVPWHRVLNAMGRISPRPGDGANHQRRRLVEEGIRFGQSGRIDLVRYRWKPQKKRG